FRILDGAGKQAEARIKESGVDPVGVHIDHAGVRVEPALLSFGVFEAVELDHALPDSDRAEAADPARIAEQFALDAKALLAVLVDDEPRPTLAEPRIYIFVPQAERLEDVAVGVHDVVGAGHRDILRMGAILRHGTAAVRAARP